MKLKITRIADGLHPSEAIVEIRSGEGAERLVVDGDSIHNDMLEVGAPVGKRNGHFLVELPRETFRGAWRVWVSKDELLEDRLEKVA